jgi:hypothetical protein
MNSPITGSVDTVAAGYVKLPSKGVAISEFPIESFTHDSGRALEL